MLHLFPIRWIIRLLLAIGVIAGLVASFGGAFADVSFVQTAIKTSRWIMIGELLIVFLGYVGWRFIPRIQRLIFPYLGGKWIGVLRFDGHTGSEERTATLEIRHTLVSLRLLLETEESESETLAVYPERDPDFERYRLYYVYLNQRKVGVAGSGERYRGVAVIRVQTKPELALLGDYFTEQKGSGQISLRRQE